MSRGYAKDSVPLRQLVCLDRIDSCGAFGPEARVGPWIEQFANEAVSDARPPSHGPLPTTHGRRVPAD
jgi:hypothetical protein